MSDNAPLTRADLDRAVEALTTNQSEATAELRHEIGSLRERLDNRSPMTISVDARMAGITRSMDRLIGEHDTRARLEALEKKAS